MRNASWLVVLLCLWSVILPLVSGFAPSALAQGAPAGYGKIAGKVLDESNGKPLAFATVMVANTQLGCQSGLDGSFIIDRVPPGVHTVTASMVGFAQTKMEGVEVQALRTTTIELKLTPSEIRMNEVEVKVEKSKVDVQSSESKRSFSTEEAKVRVINTVQDALSQQAGVVSLGGQLYVRGGRSDEVKYYIDGLPVTDPLGGGSSITVSLASLEDVNLLSGGFDAEFGNAQSGVVQLVTKEGTPKFTGLVKFMTDDFGAPDKTYFNSDDVLTGIGGPTPVNGLTFYASGEGFFSDTYLGTKEVRPVRKWLGLEFRERQRNLFSGQAKLSYKFHGTMKLVGELLQSQENYDNYAHGYSRMGYWSPTAGPGGTGMWWFEPLDSTFTYYNAPEHTANRENQHTQGHLRFTHTLNDATFYTAAFGMHRFYNAATVKDKNPVDYNYTTGARDDYDPLNLFYVIRGDAGEWRKQWSRTYTVKSELTSERGKAHRMKSGLQIDYFDLEMDERAFPSEENPYGLFPDRYGVNPWGASWYIQDRMRHEGMVINAGLRVDMFDPSREALDRANQRRVLLGLNRRKVDLFDRLIYQVSPRLGMAYPISDRDVLRFHYGRFQEVPSHQYLYEHTGSDTEINPNTLVGNPFLDAKTTISYEVGVEHQFWGLSTVNLTFFYRDVFGLVGSDVEESAALDPRNPPGVTYINLDYGTMQGLEFSLVKHRSATGRWSGGVTYTYSSARGSSSSETQGWNVATGGQDQTPITELILDWDRPNVLSGNLHFEELGVWGMTWEAQYSSGAPYTPRNLYDKQVLVDKINTGRLPSIFELSLKAQKAYKIYGQEFSLFLEGTNLTDRKNVFVLNPGGSIYYNVYYTEQHQLGGAYNLRDVRQDLEEDILLPLHDPRVYDQPRSFRVGIQFDW